MRILRNGKLKHNTIWCEPDPATSDGGCSGNLTMYEEFGVPQNNVVKHNYFPGGSFYYSLKFNGGDNGRIRIIDNVFGTSVPVLGVIAFLALLLGATGVFAQLQGALNTVWDVKPTGRGVKGFMIKRALSFGMILRTGFLLLVSLALSAVVSALSSSMACRRPGSNHDSCGR